MFDSLIFDMDGTLWDAVNSYVKVWDVTFEALGMPPSVDRESLVRCMGMPIDEIYAVLVNDNERKDEFLRLLDRNENEMMGTLGGVLYPGVRDYIPELAKHYQLFMVSNCGAMGLVNFLTFTRLKPYFTDTLSYGQTNLSKSGNIRMLCERYSLKSPIYIGDTCGDCVSAHDAGVPMMHAAYGFGTAIEADYTVKSFDDLASFFLND